MVARSASDRLARPGPKNSTNFPTTPFLRSICVTVSTRSVAVAPSGSAPCKLKPTTSGTSMTVGWPSMAASASMPPTPQPTTPRPLIMVVCESVPTTRVGKDHRLSVRSSLRDDRREVLQVHLVHDARAGRDDAEVVERAAAPAQERVALAIALVLDLDVLAERLRRAERVHLHRVIDHQVDGLERVDELRVPAHALHGVAHRRQIDHAGDTGEVLQDHARRHEGDLALRRLLRVPVEHRGDVLARHRSPVLAPQQILEQDAQRDRQTGDTIAERVEAVEGVAEAPDLERATGFQTVGTRPHDVLFIRCRRPFKPAARLRIAPLRRRTAPCDRDSSRPCWRSRCSLPR